MGDVIGLQDRQLIENDELIVDLCRFQEGILTERQVRKKHKLDNTTWERLGSDEGDALVEKVEAESIRRQRDGSTKRELAQKHIVRGPEILNSIAADSSASPGHRADAIKVLDTMSATGPEAAPASDRFVIQINLGADTLRFNKSIAIDANDVDPNDIDASVIATIASSKRGTDGGGQPI